MATNPNKSYPLTSYGEIRTNLLRTIDSYATNTYTTNSYPTVITQQNVFANSGSTILSGFTAGNAIGKYQPVCFFTNTGSDIYLSGATGVAQGGILGVAAADYTAGQTVDVITQGLIPFCVTGSAVAINRGAFVVNSMSGSVFKSGSLYMVDNFSTQVATITSGSGILGIALITGSASVTHGHPTVHVWLYPRPVGAM